MWRQQHPKVRLVDAKAHSFPFGLELTGGDEIHDLVTGHIEDFGRLFKTDTHLVSKPDRKIDFRRFGSI
jgi:hypothetical protein